MFRVFVNIPLGHPPRRKVPPCFVCENHGDEAQLRELVFGYPNRPRHLFMAPKSRRGAGGRSLVLGKNALRPASVEHSALACDLSTSVYHH